MIAYGQPGHFFEQFLWAWHEDWREEYANAYDVAEDWLSEAGTVAKTEVVAGIDELLALPEAERIEAVPARLPYRTAEDLTSFLRAVRDRAAGGPALVADHSWVPPGEEREGPYPELLNLARYLDDCTNGVQRSAFLPPTAQDPMVALHYRLSNLAAMYSERLRAEVAALREAEPTAAGRLAALGGSAVWHPEQDPDEFLDAVDLLARWKVERGRLPLTDEELQESEEPGFWES